MTTHHFKHALLAAVLFSGCATDTGTDTGTDTEETETATQSLPGPGGCTQQVQTGTFFYADPGRTQFVGSCTITCAEFAQSAFPYPGGGGHCQGDTSTAYQVGFIGTCHVCRF